VRRGRRLISALMPVVCTLLIALSPAAQRSGRDGVERAGTAAIHALDASLANLSAVGERVPVPSVWPMQAASVDALAGIGAVSWLVFLFAAALALGCVALTRRDRAPPRLVPVRA
jgi:hypothetical protein